MKKSVFFLSCLTLFLSLHATAQTNEPPKIGDDNMCGCTTSSNPEENQYFCRYNPVAQKDECYMTGDGVGCNGEYLCP